MDIINCVPDCFSERGKEQKVREIKGKKGMESDTHWTSSTEIRLYFSYWNEIPSRVSY